MGSDWANCELGEMFYYGIGVPEDKPKAAEYFEKAAGCLDENDMHGFGDMYRYGYGVEKNIAKAIFWYEQESYWGDRDATFALGEIYRDGEGGIQPDGKQAVHYFMELAFNVSEAHYEMMNGAKFYEDGQNIPMPYEEHAYFFSFDCNCGDDEARFELGCMYLYGQAVEKDVYRAAWCFAKTDELYRFNTRTIFDLAEMYRTGDGVDKDIDVAIAWYEKIIEWWSSDVDKALFALAEIYLNGKGVRKNLNKARYYLDKIMEGLRDTI